MNKYLPPTTRDEEVFERINAIERKINKPPVEKILLTIKEVAQLLGLSYWHVYRHIIKRPDFPAPVNLEGGGKKCKRLYLKSQVIEFINQRYYAAQSKE